MYETHYVQPVAPWSDCDPAGQVAHIPVLPTDPKEYDPELQGVQIFEPAKEVVPAAQIEQTVPESGEEVPAGQIVQEVEDVLCRPYPAEL